MPQHLYWYARSQEFDKVQEFNLYDCIECGCCDYVCPSQIPLVQYYRFAKAEIWKREQEKQKSDIARQRHEFRQFRLEREKEEKAAKHREKKAALGKKDSVKKEGAAEPPEADPKKAAILAALERSKAKKAAAGIQPQNIDNLTESQKKLIAEVDARRAEQRAKVSTTDSNKDTKDNTSSWVYTHLARDIFMRRIALPR